MKRRSKSTSSRDEDVNKIVGLGSKSIHKSYYPELKDKVKSLDRQNVYNQAILNSIPDSVVITDQTGIIKQVNPALTKIFGFSFQELKGKHFSVLYSDEVDSCFTENKVQFYRCKDGSQLVGEVLGSEIIDLQGNFLGQLQVIRDITERVESQKRQRELEEQLLKSHKMEAIGSLAGGIAHDFNNILSGIIGYAELVELFEISDVDEIKENLNEILKASYRARDLVKQILLFSRRGDHEFEPTQLSNVVLEVVKLLNNSLPDNIEIETHIETENDTFLADSTQIHQVLTNLCTNGIFAMKETGGKLSIRVEEVDNDSRDFLPEELCSIGPILQLQVSDSGCGIPKELRNHVFEPYFTTKKAGEGTGFGLALVHGIVKSHGGHIDVESKVGEGTCFTIFFPRKEIGNNYQEQIETMALQPGNGRVMLVDDEVPQLKWGKEFMQRLGYLVDTYNSAKEAYKVFKSSPDKYDVVITDQTIPGMTGIELAQSIRLLRQDIPIVICTGFSNSLSSLAIQKAGITKVINKPYSLKEMAETLDSILG